MPIYEYECLECGVHFDLFQRLGEPQPGTCPNGHKQVHRVLPQPAIIFKGSGFYSTDHRHGGHLRHSGHNGHNGHNGSSHESSKHEDTEPSNKPEGDGE